MSGRDLAVRIEAVLPPGAVVQVMTDDLIIMAEVSHCGEVANGYVAGLSIQNALEIHTLTPQR